MRQVTQALRTATTGWQLGAQPGQEPRDRVQPLLMLAHAPAWDAAQQSDGVGMARVAEDLLDRTVLDEAPRIEDAPALAHLGDDVEVVADEHQARVELLPQPVDEVEHLALDVVGVRPWTRRRCARSARRAPGKARYLPRAMWLQREITLEPRPRGFHLITRDVQQALPELDELEVGLCHLFIRHTSASLTLNENASPDVRRDFRTWFDQAVPERFDWQHNLEGADDMPAHIKASLLGPALSLPVSGGALALGTWQGIYLCEHRDRGGARALLATVWGQSRREP
jgi:secondary thiamine-phosphate synthase enzyme